MLGDRVEHLELFFDEKYLVRLREGYLLAVKFTSLNHLNGTAEQEWLPPIKMLNEKLDQKIKTLQKKITTLQLKMKTKKSNANNVLEERLKTAHASGHYHRILDQKNASIQATSTQQEHETMHTPYQVNDTVLIDDNFGAWIPGTITAVLENGQAYSATMKNGLKRGFVPAKSIRIRNGAKGDGGSEVDAIEHHDWDSLRADVEQTLHYLGSIIIESRESVSEGTSFNSHRSQKDVLMYFEERLMHYDLTKGGWIRHKEFKHAVEDVFGWSFSNEKKEKKKDENQTLDFTIESLYPFLDPEGRGHVEHAILIEYIQGHVSNISSTDNTELQHSQHKLDKVLRKKIKMEKKARKKWTHQPALMVASW